MDSNVIKPGDYVVVQRQAYTKVHKIKEKGTLNVGNFVVETDNVIGEKYETTFQMKPKSKKLYTLEKVEELNTIAQLNIEASGSDNRNISDDGQSQGMTKDEIDKLKDESLSSAGIVEKLINSSKSFASKTEYSQEKYMKKKEKKYFEYVQFRKPTIRLIAHMLYRHDGPKILELRIDYISQILTYANIQSTGNYLLYDSGTTGLMTASILNLIGPHTDGALIHMHPGNECQKTVVLNMQFPKEQLERCINVNLYSVLRCFYQEKETFTNITSISEDREETKETPAKRIKLDEPEEKPTEDTKKKPGWQFENEKACRILENNVDGLVVTCKEHPVSIVKELTQFLKKSRSIVVYHVLREPLEELFVYLKSTCEFVSLKLIDNFMRKYQVLPERTHPEVNMTTGGYILTGYKIG